MLGIEVVVDTSVVLIAITSSPLPFVRSRPSWRRTKWMYAVFKPSPVTGEVNWFGDGMRSEFLLNKWTRRSRYASEIVEGSAVRDRRALVVAGAEQADRLKRTRSRRLNGIAEHDPRLEFACDALTGYLTPGQ